MTLKKYLVPQSIFWAARINLATTDGVGTTSIFEVLTTYFHEISVQNFEVFTMFHMRTYTLLWQKILDIIIRILLIPEHFLSWLPPCEACGASWNPDWGDINGTCFPRGSCLTIFLTLFWQVFDKFCDEVLFDEFLTSFLTNFWWVFWQIFGCFGLYTLFFVRWSICA